MLTLNRKVLVGHQSYNWVRKIQILRNSHINIPGVQQSVCNQMNSEFRFHPSNITGFAIVLIHSYALLYKLLQSFCLPSNKCSLKHFSQFLIDGHCLLFKTIQSFAYHAEADAEAPPYPVDQDFKAVRKPKQLLGELIQNRHKRLTFSCQSHQYYVDGHAILGV